MGRRFAALAVLTAAALSAAACSSSSGGGPAVTVTQTTVVPSSSVTGATTAASSPAPSGAATAASGGSGSGSTSSPATGSGAGTTSTTTKISNPNAEPDGFVPTKLKPGQKPPQFIAVSFDGAGWHKKWQYWFGISKKVPFHFTANLTGLYLIDKAHKDFYQGTGHPRGATALGANFWYTPAEVKQEIEDLNTAYNSGDEIATHFMGHFCDPGDSPGAASWNTAAWNNDLNQFFDALKNYKTIDNLPNLPSLDFPASEVKGERTPCLQGDPDQLFPALVQHHLIYDQSVTHRGISWPSQSSKYHIWQMGMAEFPMHGIARGHGANHFQITMDYNFWYSQEFDPATGQMRQVSQAQSDKDAKQVQATYQDMLDGALAGSHAPLLLGNHFNDWNNNAYTVALGDFLLANCGKPGIYCVPFRDVVDWMKMQDPTVLAHLQAEPPILGPPGSPNK